MKVMLNFLQKELLDDHYSKLEQAGHSPENRVPLEHVFVDLPSFPERPSEAPSEGNNGQALPPGFLAAMLNSGAMCLRADEAFTRTAETRSLPQPEPVRHVLIGGPGQGKSTLAQFLCQIHRASLLRGRRGLEADAKHAMTSIIGQSTKQGLDPARARRFPLRIELARFAKTLATQQDTNVTSILSYVTFIIREQTDYNVTADTLRKWLQDYPWLLILDGLDEVPASSNRAQVLDAVRDFQVDVASCGADVLFLATTRPQGYNEEFAPRRYSHSWLAPLSIARALHYGTTLVDRTYRHDSQRKKEVLGRLQDAAKVAATVRLMESPLQITIMARLLAQIAKPPQERYRLFQQYYEVIYRREMERGVPVLSQLLRDYETDIHAIHHRTGLLLHIESERSQHTDATLANNEFRDIVCDRLDKEGHAAEVRGKLTDETVKCATDRLVFLVPSQSERVGFEIRSLQEFMAAEALMDGKDDVVVRRIKTIAAVPFWQNVLLFAAGKCFADRQWLRDSISEVCAEMNDDPEDQLAHCVLAGSRVALALLEDGPSRRQPAYSQALARRALSLLALPPLEIHDRLADVYETEFETVYKEEIQRRFDSQEWGARLTAWRVLLRLGNKKAGAWAREYAEANWPSGIQQQSAVFRLSHIAVDPWLCKKYEDSFFTLPLSIDQWERPFRVVEHMAKGEVFGNKLVETALQFAARWWHIQSSDNALLPLRGKVGFRFMFAGLKESKKRLSAFLSLGEVNQYWMPLVESARFAAAPTNQELARVLRSMAENLQEEERDRFLYTYGLPWPIAACLGTGQTAEELRSLADRAICGEMGDHSDWHEAEKRWRDKGLSLDDVRHMADDQWPIPRDIANAGFPFGGCGLSWDQDELGIDVLGELWHLLPGVEIKRSFAPWYLHILLRGHRRPFKLSAQHDSIGLRDLVASVLHALEENVRMAGEAILALAALCQKTDPTMHLLDLLGRKLKGIYRLEPGLWAPTKSGEDINALFAEAVNSDSSLVGLCLLLSLIAETNKISEVPDCVPSLVGNEDPCIARSGLFLSLCRPELPSDELRRIAETFVKKHADDDESLERLISVTENNLMQNGRAWHVLDPLWQRIPIGMDGPRRRVIELMLILLGRRVARLQEESVWRDLDLPPGLHQILRREAKR